jgi:predicted SAM-dependent methyltransferase
MQNKKPLKIDIGAGIRNKKAPLDEWTHLDVFPDDHMEIVCDFGHIPIENGEVDEIYSGDVIEHIEMGRRDEVLKEWNRILKIGGVFTGSTPNLHSTMMRYASGELSMEDAYGALYGSQETSYQQHYTTYTTKTLKALLEKYGFGCIDFSESPGNDDPMNSWWVVWTCIKVKNL